jgi:hypothetical protein
MMEIEYTNGHDENSITTVDPWSLLPEELSHPSFLTCHSEHDPILDIFVDVATTENSLKLNKLLSSEFLNKNAVSLPSLFARVWTTSSYSARTRATALNRFTLLLAAADSSYDYQGFLPHLIVALCDTSKEVRAAATYAISALDADYRAATASRTTVVGITDLYVEEEGSLKWLLPSTAHWLICDALAPKLEECRLDCNYVVNLLASVLNGAGKKGKKDQYDPTFLSDDRNPTALMVCLASHVVCSFSNTVQFTLLRILNDPSIEAAPAVKLRAQSLQLLLERFVDIDFATSFFKDKQIDATEFMKLLVESIAPGSSTIQITILLDLVKASSVLAAPACQQLSVVFPTTGQNTQLQIAKLLFSQLETAPIIAKVASATLDSIDLPTAVILSLLDDVKIEVESDGSPARKRQRTESARSSPATMPEGPAQSTRRLTLLLEVLERQDQEGQFPVVGPLFGILDRLLVAETDTRTSLNYPKQIVLSCLSSIINALPVLKFCSVLIAGFDVNRSKVIQNRYVDNLYPNIDESTSTQQSTTPPRGLSTNRPRTNPPPCHAYIHPHERQRPPPRRRV